MQVPMFMMYGWPQEYICKSKAGKRKKGDEAMGMNSAVGQQPTPAVEASARLAYSDESIQGLVETLMRALNSLANYTLLRHLRSHQFTALAFNSPWRQYCQSGKLLLPLFIPTPLASSHLHQAPLLHSPLHSAAAAAAEEERKPEQQLQWRRGLSLRASCSPRWSRRPSSAWSSPGPAPWRRRRAKVRVFLS